MVTTLQRKSVTDLELSPTSTQSNQPVYAFLSVQGNSISAFDSDDMDRQALYLHHLALGLAEQGHQVDIFTRREHPYQPEILEHQPGLRTIRLTAGPVMMIPRTQVLAYLLEGSI